MSGLRSAILSTDDITCELVHVPEWDVTVEVRSMSLLERERVGELASEAQAAKEEGRDIPPQFSAAVVVACSFDPETGEQLFTNADIPALNGKSAKATGRISEVGARLSGLTDDAEVEAGKD